jgi:hypothetical protein
MPLNNLIGVAKIKLFPQAILEVPQKEKMNPALPPDVKHHKRRRAHPGLSYVLDMKTRPP